MLTRCTSRRRRHRRHAVCSPLSGTWEPGRPRGPLDGGEDRHDQQLGGHEAASRWYASRWIGDRARRPALPAGRHDIEAYGTFGTDVLQAHRGGPIWKDIDAGAAPRVPVARLRVPCDNGARRSHPARPLTCAGSRATPPSPPLLRAATASRRQHHGAARHRAATGRSSPRTRVPGDRVPVAGSSVTLTLTDGSTCRS